MKKYADDVLSMVEPANDGSGNWYWSITINGELYADGEEGAIDLANHKATLALNEWKEQLA